MVDYKVSYRYASSLLKMAEDKNILENVSNDSEFIKNTLRDSSELRRILENPVIKPHDKISILREIFKSHVHTETMKFLEFIIHKNREDLLFDIFHKFIELHDEKLGIVNINVKTAFEFDNDQKENLRTKLEKYLNKKARISFEIDYEIIGGFIAKVGDTVYDASLRHQLNMLKKQFLSGGSLLN